MLHHSEHACYISQCSILQLHQLFSLTHVVHPLYDAGRSYITLEHALQTLLPEFYSSDAQNPEELDPAAGNSDTRTSQEADTTKKSKVKLVRVQGIELDMDIPFLWVANNLKNPEYYLHVCVYVNTRKQ